MASETEDTLGRQKTSDNNNYEGKFNTLRIISLKAIDEFEVLQKKCEENYAKYLEERENYMRTKKELDILKEVSGEALSEYENLHRKYQIEQGCRDKAEEFAKQAVRDNKQLKRQSAMLINTLTTKVVDFNLEELANATENLSSPTTEEHGICNKQIEGLKEQVESLKIENDEISQKLNECVEKLHTEQKEHERTKQELENNQANYKQLNRVSVLALEDYSYLQQKYEMEMQYRVQAEKLAAEESNDQGILVQTASESMVSRDHEAMVKQNQFISNDTAGEERLEKALQEISTLTKQLHVQKEEFDEKVKELEDELASSNDVQRLKSLEAKINTFAQGMETLETRLAQAQNRADEAEAKAKTLEEKLKKAQESDVPSAPPLPPPPPPPPPPAQLLRKFVGIIGSGKKSKSQKKVQKEDPRITAMAEMMERIKSGRVELKKTAVNQTKSESDGEAMQNLKQVLRTLKRSPSKESFHRNDGNDGDEKTKTFGVQLRKTERKPRSMSEVDDVKSELKTMTLRKPRSHSTGDMLDEPGDEPDMDQDLLKLLKKHKAAAERELKEPKLKEDPQQKQQNEQEDESEMKQEPTQEQEQNSEQ